MAVATAAELQPNVFFRLSGDVFVVEGTSHGEHKERDLAVSAGVRNGAPRRWCDVFGDPRTF